MRSSLRRSPPSDARILRSCSNVFESGGVMVFDDERWEAAIVYRLTTTASSQRGPRGS